MISNYTQKFFRIFPLAETEAHRQESLAIVSHLKITIKVGKEKITAEAAASNE